VLAAAGAATLFYFWRVTGSPFRTPFFVNLSTYDPVPYFPWESIGPWPVYHHEIIKKFYSGWLLQYYEFGRSQPIVSTVIKLGTLWSFYVGPLFTVPVLILAVVLPRGFSIHDISRNTQVMMLIAGFTLVGFLLPVFTNPHYAAPLTCVVYALVLSVMQRIRLWRWHDRASGLAFVRTVPTLAVVLFFIAIGASALKFHQSSTPQTWCSPYQHAWDRPAIQARMEELAGRQLLLVRYGTDHDPRRSWVANGADIDGSKLVWANDMDSQQNQELIEYFRDRRVWLVEPDAIPARVSEYVSPQK
jgi:hypothetical protein